MASMTLSQFQEELLLMLDDLESSDPLVAAGVHTRALNRAANKMVRTVVGRNSKNAELFPELRNSWTEGPTVVGSNSWTRPADCIIVTSVVHSDEDVISNQDWSSVRERPMGKPVKPETIGLMDKDSDTDGYPSVWARKAKTILYWPTTRTGYTTYFRFYGLSRIQHISSASETFPTEEDFDPIILAFAAAEMAVKLGWSERAKEFEAAAMNAISTTVNVTSLGGDEGFAEVEGAPTRYEINGGE